MSRLASTRYMGFLDILLPVQPTKRIHKDVPKILDQPEGDNES